MTIAWMYLDKKAAAISALKDYASMKHILTAYVDDATEVRKHLVSIPTPTLMAGVSREINPHATESHIVRTLDLIDVVKQRYDRAMEYMAWFRPAWDALSEEERLILSVFYQQEDVSRLEIIQRLGDMLGLEKSAVYTRKDKAACHLALLLYGK